jgi:hypothetical protein
MLAKFLAAADGPGAAPGAPRGIGRIIALRI